MLQISTGKLFARPVGRENLLRGMLYTNAILAREEAVETVAGRLSASSSYSIRPTVLVYELTERMEAEEQGAGSARLLGRRTLSSRLFCGSFICVELCLYARR